MTRQSALVAVALFGLGCGGGGGSGDAPDAAVGDSIDAAAPDAGDFPAHPCAMAATAASLSATEPSAPHSVGPLGAAVCNPVTQVGCQAGEKCATKIESASPFLAQTTCVPNGSVAPGDACTQSAPGAGPADGVDDCMAAADTGYTCITGTCNEVCTTTPNSCSVGSCVLFSGLFDDVEGAGACVPGCDAVAQNCADCEGCVFNLQQEGGVCAPIPAGAENQKQDDPCLGPNGLGSGACFLNGCAFGYGANVPEQNAPMSDFVCAKYCTPAITTADPGEGDNPAGIENHPGGQYSCASPFGAATEGPDAIPNERYQCRFFNSFYGDSAAAPDSLGFCADKTIWGDCLTVQLDACLADQANFDPNTSPPDHPCFTIEPGCAPVAEFANGKIPDYLDILRGKGKLQLSPDDLRDDLIGPPVP